MHGFADHVGYPHHQGLSKKPGLLSSKRHRWVSSGLQTAGSPTSTRLGSFHRLKRYKKKTADLSRDTKKGGRVMDALVKRCECCNGPVPETKRGRPQRYCSDRSRQVHRKTALRTGNDLRYRTGRVKPKTAPQGADFLEKFEPENLSQKIKLRVNEVSFKLLMATSPMYLPRMVSGVATV